MAVEQVTGGRDPESAYGLGLLLLVSCSLVTGTLVAAAFLLPATVGALISGQALLGLGLTFVGAVLTLLAALPDRFVESSTTGGETAAGREDRQSITVRERFADRLREAGDEVDVPVFVSGVALATLVVAGFLVVPDRTMAAVATLEGVVFEAGRGLLLVAVLVFVFAAIVLAVGPWGRIKLGGESATPEFSTPAYVAMLFSAGIAAGIVFWGPAEALLHYDTVPPFLDVASRSDSAVVGALQYTMFHWGVSAWSVYLAVGLPIAYAVYNRDAPLRVSSVLVPLFGADIVEHPLGRVVDVLAVVATLGGLSTTLGFLSAQFLTGIEYRWGVTLGPGGELLLVSGLTVIFAVSAVTGVRRGIRRLSELNSLAFLVLLGSLAVLGPLGFVASVGSSAVAGYVTEFVPMSLYGATGGTDWLSGWTIFYWAWWLSWSPFVGLFLARISRGRRVRTVVLSTVGATSLATLVWFVVVGGTALSLQHSGTADILGVIDATGVPAAGFPVFDAVLLGDLLLVVFLLLVLTFFVTSADAATRSLALLTSSQESPSMFLRSVLAALIGTIAAVLILFGGSETVQSAAVVVGGPFAVVALLALVGLAVAIRRDM
ncbi:MAG: BCCT family transporter [Halobacteriales archaeon]